MNSIIVVRVLYHSTCFDMLTQMKCFQSRKTVVFRERNHIIEGVVIIIIIRRTFIKRHKSGNIHSEALYMSMYT